MYKYYMISRPAGPGAQPMVGLQNIIDLNPNETVPAIKRSAYALLEYDRCLTLQEKRMYELLPADPPADVEYRGYIFEWDEQEQSWRIYPAGNPCLAMGWLDSVEEAKAGIDEYLATSEKEA